MKRTVLSLVVLLQSFATFAQEGYIKHVGEEQNYQELRSFLANKKFNLNSFRHQFEEWFGIARKKEFASAILVDNRHVIQSRPVNYDSKDLIWVSPSKQYSYRDSYEYINSSIGNQIAQDVVNDLGNNILKNIGKSKFHYRYSASENNKPYQKPVFLQF